MPPPSDPSPTLRWRAAALGLPAHATLRCLAPSPDGRLAAGSDYGLALLGPPVPGPAGRWPVRPFPFPRGARREARHVEALAAWGGELHVATARTRYRWRPGEAEARGRGLARHADGGLDDVRSLLATPDGLLAGHRSALWRLGPGGEARPVGPGDATSLTLAPGGAAFAGTLDGRLLQVDGPELRRFRDEEGRPAPVRHLAWAAGHLWVAAAGGLHARDPAGRWTRRPGEPYALLGDGSTLWALRAGRLWRGVDGGPLEAVALPLHRPWTLARWRGWLAVGEVGGLTLLPAGGDQRASQSPEGTTGPSRRGSAAT